MSQLISPLAGKPVSPASLVDVHKLLAAYTDLQPDPGVPAQRVASGTSGHRGTSFDGWFAARPSGTEDIYKIYAESFRDDAHLRLLLAEGQRIVDAALDLKE